MSRRAAWLTALAVVAALIASVVVVDVEGWAGRGPSRSAAGVPSALGGGVDRTAGDWHPSGEVVGAVEGAEAIAPRYNIHTNPIPRIIRTGPASRPRVAITIDDLFGQSGTAQLAQVLDLAEARGVRLTLFPTGSALEDAIRNGQQEVWRRAVRDGDEIGNHTYSHANVPTLSDAAIRDELRRTQDALDRVLGPGFDYKLRLFRPPGGAGGFGPGGNPRLMRDLDGLGYTLVMWSIDSNNTGGFDSYVDKIVGPTGARDGSIILTHLDTVSPANIATLIDRLRAEHLEPVTVSELFIDP